MKFGCRGNQDKIGILLAQLGTPEAPTKKALRPYLKQFLSDPRVIEANRALWWVILNGLVLNTRPKRSARLYKRIWTEKGSPLLVITKSQNDKLQQTMKARFGSLVEVDYGMRYGQPSLEAGLDRLREKGCARIFVFPMYPQYSATTSASTYDAIFLHLLKLRWVPTLRVAAPYYNDTRYLQALAAVTNEGLKKLDYKPEKLVFSYHGVPRRYIVAGDPYCCMCTETTRAICGKLDIPEKDIIHTFQSRFGKEPWLEPYTDETIAGLADSGIKDIAVACPGFTTDCLETLDEIGNEGTHLFQEHGGERLSLIPCLNDHPAWIAAMEAIIVDEISSWVDLSKEDRASCAVRCPSGCAA